MTKPPLATAITTLLGVVVPATMIMPVYAGDTGARNSAYVSTQTTVERELARRREETVRGEDAVAKGDRAMKDRDYETAFAQYRLACTEIPNSKNTGRLYSRALHGFCDAGIALAEQRITEGRYADAENTLKVVLQPEFDPNCKRAREILAHLEEPDYYNKTITPGFRAKVEQVKQMFVDAKGFYDTGRFDLAYKRCEQILALDPYNIAARKLEEEINRKKDDYGQAGYDNTRAYMIWQVTKGWDRPVRKYDTGNTGNVVQEQPTLGRAEIIRRKLRDIVLPKLEFREATIREAIDFLHRKSVELDPTHEGINIVLRLEGGVGGAEAPAPAAAAPVIPGLEAVPGTAPAAPAAAVASGAPGNTPITVQLSNIPLGEALHYVTNLAGLKYKVDDYAVSVVPLSVPTETLVTHEWKAQPGMFSQSPTGGTSGQLEAPAATAGGGGGGADRTRGGTGLTSRIDAKDYFTALGVQFPPGSSAYYNASTSRLIVKNTQDNIDLIDAIVTSVVIPAQVEIESKFVEIQQNNLKELAFDWLLGQANVPGSGKIFTSGGTTGSDNGVNANNFPFPVGAGQGQTFPVTSSLRSGTLAISQNAIDALLAGTSGLAVPSPATAAIAGVFTDPSFQVVIHAINQKKGVDLLSAPRVTTKSGQRAVIEIIREFRYPTEFEPPQIPQTFGNTNGNNGGTTIIPSAGGVINPLATQSQGSFPVTPTTPTAFETRNTGVTLEVEPVIGPDGVTIDLNLVPQVVEFEGFINYGSPIQTSSTNGLGQSVTNIITPNVINQPIFSTRKVTTSVTIYDGNTVVLGGLMREDVQKTEDKIPLIGDIPLFGRLFRSQSEQHLKTNLIIFVSARLINPAGEPVHNEEEQEEVVQTLPTPEITPPPLQLMPK